MTSTPHSVTLSHPLLAQIGRLADRTGVTVYVVGGYVRDLLLGKESRDIDILVMGDGIAFARVVAGEMGNPAVVTYERFGTAMLPLPSGKMEFVGARKEKYSASSRNPDVAPGTLEDDLRRRDFTVNALAVALNGDRSGMLMDLFEGRRHLDEKMLRTPLDPAETFDDDPLRMLRALRFASQLEFTVDPGVLQAIGQMKDRVRIVSQERVSEELQDPRHAPPLDRVEAHAGDRVVACRPARDRRHGRRGPAERLPSQGRLPAYLHRRG